MTPSDFRAARATLGLGQKNWGLWLGLTRSQVARIEAGGRVTPMCGKLVLLYLAGSTPPTKLIALFYAKHVDANHVFGHIHFTGNELDLHKLQLWRTRYDHHPFHHDRAATAA
jgi:hypothetical protein